MCKHAAESGEWKLLPIRRFRDCGTVALCVGFKVLNSIAGSFLAQDRMRKLRLFPDETHNLEGFPMEEYVMPPRNVREMRPRQKRALKKNEIAAKLAAEKKAASAGAQA